MHVVLSDGFRNGLSPREYPLIQIKDELICGDITALLLYIALGFILVI